MVFLMNFHRNTLFNNLQKLAVPTILSQYALGGYKILYPLGWATYLSLGTLRRVMTADGRVA